MASMVEKAKHRGPDGKGIWGDEFITLGHNLLSIVDTPHNQASHGIPNLT